MKIKRKNHTSTSQKDKVETPSLGSTIKETIIAGFGLGVGSEIANRAVSAVLGPRQISIESSSDKDKEDRCQQFRIKYEQCLKDQKNDKCVNELENYQQCLKSL
jgi:hypothetical protein